MGTDDTKRDEKTAKKIKSNKISEQPFELIENDMQESSVPKLAHEFRTRLAVIKGALDNTIDGVFGKLNPGQKKSLYIASEGVERMSELVEDLMASLAPGRAHIRINREKAQIEDIARHAIESIHSLAYKEGINLLAHVPRNAPSVFCDPIKIEQVLLNLFRNAIKFTPRGGTITINVREKNSHVEVVVHDTGAGIPAKKLESLFADRELAVLRTADGGYRTSGIGLIIVKDILDAHDSNITVKSELGKGTTITFTLPKAVD